VRRTSKPAWLSGKQKDVCKINDDGDDSGDDDDGDDDEDEEYSMMMILKYDIV